MSSHTIIKKTKIELSSVTQSCDLLLPMVVKLLPINLNFQYTTQPVLLLTNPYPGYPLKRTNKAVFRICCDE